DNIAVSGTASDAASGVQAIQYNLNGGGWTDAAGTTNWTISLEGLTNSLTHQIQFRAVDNAGNTSGITTRNFRVDLATPALAVTGGNTGATLTYLNSDIVLSGTGSDANGL